MKRSKYEEKSMGPMFPRLHVNDTERGGPRAPPRNKMALYEQLTIPSNRHNPGNTRLNQHSGASQGSSHERITYFPSYQPPVTRPLASHSADRLQRQTSDVANLRSSVSQVEQKRKPEDEDDFSVPIFSQPGKEQGKVAHQSRNDEGRCRTFSSSCSLRLPNSCNKQTDQPNSDTLNLRQDREDQNCEQTTVLVSSSDPTVRYSADVSAREPSDGVMETQEAAVMHDQIDINKTSRDYTNVGRRYSDSCGPISEAKGRISSRLKSNSPLCPSNRNEFDCENEGKQKGNSLLRANMDRGNDVSRTTTVVTVSDFDVSPDNVVEAIGLKHFWKARRAIVNQQRVFSVQVFELHRLIKVQQLIAESPEVLIDASAFIGQSSIKASPLKKFPAEYTMKALADSNKPKGDFQKPNHNDETEDVAENAVAKETVASPPTQRSSHLPFPTNPPGPIPTPPMAIPQPGGHQWLVPVMSPSEGLIYKPYPGPGFPAPPVCGGFGPHGTTPVPSHFMNPNYGVPPSHYYPHPHPGYFPPYGMSMMNSAMSGSSVDQIKLRSISNPNEETAQTTQTVIRMPNFSGQQQGSCNIPSQRHSEILGSTGSSPSERAQDIIRPRPTTTDKDALTFFPAAPVSGASQPRKTNQPTTVIKAVPHNARTAGDHQPTTLIKVVPHNARTATESAARIFRSIQEERRHHQPN
uniref:Early flowering 3 n=1 Tax=Fagopyrum esculentum TaxID=3617 RepID=H1ACZ4_FAGES|nr:early flowering 3 [Fagopyrum esculentum]